MDLANRDLKVNNKQTLVLVFLLAIISAGASWILEWALTTADLGLEWLIQGLSVGLMMGLMAIGPFPKRRLAINLRVHGISRGKIIVLALWQGLSLAIMSLLLGDVMIYVVFRWLLAGHLTEAPHWWLNLELLVAMLIGAVLKISPALKKDPYVIDRRNHHGNH